MIDWQAIMARDGPSAWQAAYRVVGNRADADECFQEAFLGALAVSRREPVENWRALLQRLATARAVDRLRERTRRRAREDPAVLDDLGGAGEPPSRGAEEAELAAGLRKALVELPPRQAQVFCLHHLESWSYREIAGRLAISVDSVGVLLHRARRRLRDRLATLVDADPTAPPAPRTAGKEVP